MLDACGLEDYEVRIGHVGVLRDILTGLGLSQEGEPEAPVASAMRLLDKGDWDGLNELFTTHGIDSSATQSLKNLSELDGGIETLESARSILSEMGVYLDSLDEL